MQQVHGGVMLFHEVHAQLSEGAMFYADLLQRLAQLNQTCEDLVRGDKTGARLIAALELQHYLQSTRCLSVLRCIG